MADDVNADMNGICSRKLILCTAGETVRCQQLADHEGDHTYAAKWAGGTEDGSNVSVGIKWGPA